MRIYRAIISADWLRFQYKLDKLRALESIRVRTAADFHDELGNRLTRIALFSELLESSINESSSDSKEYIRKIQENSSNLNNFMRDFLWALDPAKDSLADLAVLLMDFGVELFDKTGINFHATGFDEKLKGYTLNMEMKRHLVNGFKGSHDKYYEAFKL